MATEKEMREAIRDLIATAAPDAIVIPRNILGIKNDAWLNMLQSPSDSNRVRGWFISQRALQLIEQRTGAAEYDVIYDVWQFYQYYTGSNTTNSEDVFSAERDAVTVALAAVLPDPLTRAKPLEFSLIDLFPVGQAGMLMHIAQGTIAIGNVTVTC